MFATKKHISIPPPLMATVTEKIISKRNFNTPVNKFGPFYINQIFTEPLSVLQPIPEMSFNNDLGNNLDN